MCSSFLAPIYLIYESHEPAPAGREPRLVWETGPEAAPVVAFVAREMAARFAQERLDPGVAEFVIPDITVGNLEPGQATIRDAFFGEQLD